MAKENVEVLILSEIDFEKKVPANSHILGKFGFKDSKEYYSKLKEMKEMELVSYNEVEEGLFKGEPQGDIIITEKGKRYLEDNK